MTSLRNVSLPQSSWILLVYLLGILGLPGCAEMSALMGTRNISESEKTRPEEAATLPALTPPPSIEEVKEAISSTKTLLDDQQKHLHDLLSLRGEVKQSLREFRDQDLTPLKSSIQALQHQVAAWEGATATNHTTATSTFSKIEQDIAQTKAQVGIYGDQVTALVDQVDQNNRQYEKLLTEFQNSLVGFKEVMGEFKVEFKAENSRAAQEARTLANQLKEQEQSLNQVSLKTQEILVLQKRLNQLHVYINQVRDKVTSDTTALQAALKPVTTENFQDLLASLEERYQQLAQNPSSNLAITEHLQTLEHRVEQSEKHLDETVKTLHEDIQGISAGVQSGLKTPETENLQALVLALEERYQQLTQIPPPNLALSEHLQALEKRVEQSENHYTETVKALHKDIQEISVGMRTSLNNKETENLRALVQSLEERYQQLAQAPSSEQTLTKHLQALEQQLAQSEANHTETVKALQYDVQKVSARMLTFAQSMSVETVEALHHDIQEVSAGMLKLAQSISHLEKTKSPTSPIHAGSITAPESPR